MITFRNKLETKFSMSESHLRDSEGLCTIVGGCTLSEDKLAAPTLLFMPLLFLVL